MCGNARALWRGSAVVSEVSQAAPVDVVEKLRVCCDCRQVSECAEGCRCGASSHNVVN